MEINEDRLKLLNDTLEERAEEFRIDHKSDWAKGTIRGMHWAFSWLLGEKDLPETLRDELNLEASQPRSDLEKLKDYRETVHDLYEDSEDSYDQHILSQLSRKLEDAIQALE